MAAFDPARNAIMMDLGTGPVPIDAGFAAAVHAFCDRRHDMLLKADEPDRLQARALRTLSFDLDEAERDQRAHQREACPVLTLIPRVEPLRCQIVPLNPSRWPAGTSFGPDAA